MAKRKTTTKKTAKRKTTSRKRKKTASVRARKQFRTYNQAMQYLYERTDYETQKRVRYNVTTFNLDRMNKLLSLLGDPHKKLETVHIAGTKGKGSTATMLARMLQSCGMKVGLYTSPHVLSVHERITVNSKMITEGQMLDLLNRVYAPVEKVAKDDAPSFFEIMTALAFLYFCDHKTDIAIVETGLGGRLDSTNVIMPKLIGITNISLDHQHLLGNKVENIAMEKAGVFKNDIPVITVEQKPEVMKVLKSHASTLGAPLSVTGKDIDFSFRFENSREHGPHNRICLTTPTSKFEHLRVPLPGQHQAVNCGLALAMLDRLKSIGFQIDTEKAIAGLDDLQIPGRMEFVHNDPRILIDAAHNAESIEALMYAIGQSISYDSMVVIFGCNQDKDVHGMLDKLQYGADKVIFTRSTSPKAMMPEELAEIYTEICGKMCQTASSLGQALQLAQSAVGTEDLICITGSFYLIGQAKARFMQKVIQQEAALAEAVH